MDQSYTGTVVAISAEEARRLSMVVGTSSGPNAHEQELSKWRQKYDSLFDDYTKVCDELALAKAENAELQLKIDKALGLICE